MPDYSLPYLNGGQATFQAPVMGTPMVPNYAVGAIPTSAPNMPASGASNASGLSSLQGMSAGLGAAFGLFNGIGQLLKAKRMNPVRPEYEIPQETKDILGLRQSLLNAGLPGEQQATQDIYITQANAIANAARGASDQGQYLGLLGMAQGSTNRALNNLAVQRAQNYQANVSGLENAQRVMAAAEDKQWELNKYDPYLMQLQRKYQLQNAGNQNIESGLSAIGSLGSSSGGGGGMSGLTSLLAMA